MSNSGPEIPDSADYTLGRVLGRGGMGIVYEAWDPARKRHVAVKMLHAHVTEDTALTARVFREARLAERVVHPNVVRVYGTVMVGGHLGIEMARVEGHSLRELLATGPLPGGMAANLLGQVLEALVACHAQGVIHCDLKPGNLLVTPEGHVYLADFGIARALCIEGEATRGEAPSAPLWSTPQYTPPEAWSGERPTAKWDLHSAGLMIYETLVGALPYRGMSPAQLMAEKLKHELPKLGPQRPDLSPQFAALITSMVARDPARRPADAAAALAQLRATRECQVREGDTEPIVRVVPTAPVRRSGWWALAAVTVLALVVGLVWRFGVHGQNAGAEALPSSVGKISTPLISSGKFVYFAYDDGVHGAELWCVDQAGKTQMAPEIVVGPQGGNPRNPLLMDNGNFLFGATTPDCGEELWVCSPGSPVHDLRMVMDVMPGRMSSEPIPIVSKGQVTLFSANTIPNGRELWVTNTSAAQTGIVEDLAPGTNSTHRGKPTFIATEDGAYFRASEIEDSIYQYRFDTNSLTRLAPVKESVGTFGVLGSKFLIALGDRIYGNELYVFDPGQSNYRLLKDIAEGPIGSDPSDAFTYKDRLYFRAFSPMLGWELWVTDGTEAGTELFKEFMPGPSSGSPNRFTIFEGWLIFSAVGEGIGREFWMSDGTKESTRPLCDLWTGESSSDPYNVCIDRGRMFFSANDGTFGEELWMVQGDLQTAVPKLVVDLVPGAVGSEPHGLVWTTGGWGAFLTTMPDGPRLYHLAGVTAEFKLQSVELPTKIAP